MKVLVVNGSPRTDRSSTDVILGPFIEGMIEAGAEVEEIYTKKMDINPCLGCFNCWSKTPGVCVQKDDMAEALQKVATANILVYATPVYVDGMTSTLKAFLDRTIPLLKGIWEVRDDHCRHPLRDHVVKDGKIVLVSVSGFTERDNFESLIHHVRAASKNANREFAGAIVRPYAWAFQEVLQAENVAHIYDALNEAGKQLITKGTIDDATLETISQDLVPRDALIQGTNAYFE
ncbi:MAG: flavodoxin family protein [Candidatus Thorarchaeota archaeon]